MKIKTIGSCGSTNEELKKSIFGMSGASPLPPVILALEQTEGKGRKGRSFSSPYGKGLYLSIPAEAPSIDDALCIMPMVSVCVCRTVESLCGISCSIKWPNDVLCNGRKLCGILTEMVTQGSRRFLVIGIGVNLTQENEDFPEELRTKAISVKQACGRIIDRQTLTMPLLSSIENMIKALPKGKAESLDYYRSRCGIIGKDINVLFTENQPPRRARALEITEDFRLLVRWDNGETEALATGEVSIR